jgi:hypothetical protein
MGMHQSPRVEQLGNGQMRFIMTADVSRPVKISLARVKIRTKINSTTETRTEVNGKCFYVFLSRLRSSGEIG